MSWRARLLHGLRVPREPAAPPGDRHVRVFRAAPNYLRYRIVRWGLTNLAAAVGLVFALNLTAVIAPRVAAVVPGYRDYAVAIILFLEGVAVIGFVLQALASLLLLRLDFEQRWYIVSDRSIRIREGLIRLQEKTMTLANIQHVSVRQGPLQRLLGIADVEIRSAGGGARTEGESHADDLHVARFRGVAGADLIRDALRDRLRVFRDAGLGDPDDDHAATAAVAPATLDAARALALEARRLRLSLGSPTP